MKSRNRDSEKRNKAQTSSLVITMEIDEISTFLSPSVTLHLYSDNYDDYHHITEGEDLHIIGNFYDVKINIKEIKKNKITFVLNNEEIELESGKFIDLTIEVVHNINVKFSKVVSL